jgi:hypothetical protein
MTVSAPTLLAQEEEAWPGEDQGATQTRARKVVLVVEDESAIGQLIADAISDEPGYCAIHVAGPWPRSRRRSM